MTLNHDILSKFSRFIQIITIIIIGQSSSLTISQASNNVWPGRIKRYSPSICVYLCAKSKIWFHLQFVYDEVVRIWGFRFIRHSVSIRFNRIQNMKYTYFFECISLMVITNNFNTCEKLRVYIRIGSTDRNTD